MQKANFTAGMVLSAFVLASATQAEETIWGVQVEQLEYRLGENSDNLFAWDFDTFVGTYDYKFVWRSEAEYDLNQSSFETLENQARIQMPVSDFFDAVAGVKVDTPEGQNRLQGVLGLHGLAQQWFEIDADLFLSENPSARFEIEYEGQITNRITLVPSVKLDLPLTDDPDWGVGAFGPKLELGARVSYDLIDRLVSPYVGVHYERLFGETANIAKAEGNGSDALFGVVGVRVIF